MTLWWLTVTHIWTHLAHHCLFIYFPLPVFATLRQASGDWFDFVSSQFIMFNAFVHTTSASDAGVVGVKLAVQSNTASTCVAHCKHGMLFWYKDGILKGWVSLSAANIRQWWGTESVPAIVLTAVLVLWSGSKTVLQIFHAIIQYSTDFCFVLTEISHLCYLCTCEWKKVLLCDISVCWEKHSFILNMIIMHFNFYLH